MPRGLPFHTIHPDYSPAVYHDHPECSEGKKIRLIHRRPGTGEKPYCEECNRLAGAQLAKDKNVHAETNMAG